MPRTAKQIDFSNSSGGLGKGRHYGFQVVDFLMFWKVSQGVPGQTEEETIYVCAGLGEDGLCNEPTYDVYREDTIGTLAPYLPLDENGISEGFKKVLQERKNGAQWNGYCFENWSGLPLSTYSCHLLKGIPNWGSRARTISYNPSNGNSQAVVAQSSPDTSTSASPAQKTFSDGTKVFYPYISIETASSVTKTFEIYHAVEQESQIRALRKVGYNLTQSSSDSNEFKLIISKQGGDKKAIDIALVDNEIASFSNYHNGKTTREMNQFASDSGLIAKSNQAHLNTLINIDATGEGTMLDPIIGANTNEFILKPFALTSIGFIGGTRPSNSVPFGESSTLYSSRRGPDHHVSETSDGEAAYFSKDECYNSEVPPDEREADCSGCTGKFSKSPVWPPYKEGDTVTIVPCHEMLGTWDHRFRLFGASIAAGPVVSVHFMDTNVDGRQRVSGVGGNKGPKGEKGQKGPKSTEEGPKGEKGPEGVKGAHGHTGSKGEKGDTGFKGPKGEKAVDGADGGLGPIGPIGPIGDDGDQGPKGPAGPEGPIGATGSTGDKGDKGDKGETGEKGDFKGSKGDSGPKGPKGGKGEKGNKGEKGEKGNKGNKGEKGEKGVKGPTGDKGEKGDFKGSKGVKGEKGPKGDTGDKGEKGEKGPTGFTGEKGEKGATGFTGEKGEKGPKGDTGEKGEKGSKGDTGATGAKGEKGVKGDDGEKGEKGPKGDTGATGAKGEKGGKGDDGEKGEKGPKGDDGEKGEKGPKGDDGEKGEKGPKGDDGEKGEKGPKGDDGEKGEKGPKGDTGDDGEKGEKGPKGDTGDKGDDGDTGADGEKGEKGPKGDDGEDGDDGGAGPKGEKGNFGTAGGNALSTTAYASTTYTGPSSGGPGQGKAAFLNTGRSSLTGSSSINSVKYIDVSTHYGGSDNGINNWLDSFDSSNSDKKGSIKMYQVSDPSKFIIFDITSGGVSSLLNSSPIF